MPPPIDDRECAETKHFLSIPWCAQHLNKPHVRVWVPPASRIQKFSGEDELWAKTLNTPETFPSFITFYQDPQFTNGKIDELHAFLAVERGVAGWPGVVHGGIVATILDEVTGLVQTINFKHKTFPHHVAYMTAYLNTVYLRPVPCPATLMITARIIKLEGRKLYVEGTIFNDKGESLARADALFIALKTDRPQI
jgi:acyl-coenzyme A thioesterase PaaI-like protein